MIEKHRLEDTVRQAYEDPTQVGAYSAIAAEGLTPFEQALVAQAFAPGQRILDVGCGGGREAMPMIQMGLRVVAMDLSPAMVQAARNHAASRAATLPALAGSVTALPFGEQSFDGVAMLGQVLAHVPGRAERVAALSAVRGLLRPGGVLALTTHNHRCHWKFQLYFACVNRWRRLWRRLGRGSGLSDYDRWSSRISTVKSPRPVFFHMYDMEEALADLLAAGYDVLFARARREYELGREDLGLRQRDYLLGFIAKRPLA